MTGADLAQPLLPDSRVFDAEKAGETLMHIMPGLPETKNFQNWPPRRHLVVETARCVLDYTGGTLHADQDALRRGGSHVVQIAEAVKG